MNRRVILSVVFVMIFSLALYGCGGGGDTADNTTTTDQTEQPDTTDTSDSADTSDTSDSTDSSDTSDTSDSTSNTTSTAVKNPNRIVYTPTAEILDSLDPAFVYDSGSGMVIMNIYDTLVFYDGPQPDQFIPMISTAVPSMDNGLISDGGTTYTFPIRTGVDFHYGPVMDESGNPIPGSGELTPEDVAYSFQRGLLQDRAGGPTWMLWESFFGPSSLLEYARQLESEAGNMAEITEIGDVSDATLQQICEDVKDAVYVDAENVIMKLAQPFAPFIQIVGSYWGAILDREFMMAEIDNPSMGVQKSAGWDGTCDNWVQHYDPLLQESTIFDVANGTGPYKLDRWQKEELLVLSRNEDYWRERPAHIEEVIIQPTSEWATRLLMLQEGDSDFLTVRTANRDQLEPLIEQGLVTRYTDLETNAMYFLKINQNLNMVNNSYVGSGQLDGDGIPSDFFADLDVRKAFSYVMDYVTFRDDINGGDGRLAYGPIPSSVEGAFNTEQAYYTYDLEKAEEHFRAAMDGAVWENGFTFVWPYVPGASVVPNLGRLTSQLLRDINPKFNLQVTDVQGTQMQDDDEAGKIPVDFSSWAEDYHDAHNWVFPIFHSRGYYALTMGIDPDLQAQLDSLIMEARTEPDQAERNEIYHELQRISYENALIIPLIEVLSKIYMRSWIEGFIYNPAFPNNYYFWYLSKGEATN